MAIALNTLVPVVNTITRPWVSGTVSPSADALVLVIVANTGSATDTGSKLATDASATFGTSGSWSLWEQPGPGTSAKSSVHVWSVITSSSPGSGTITINTGASPADSHVLVIELTGIDTTTPIVGFVKSAPATAVASDTLTLATAPTVNDWTLSFSSSRNDTNGATAGSGMTLPPAFNAFHASPSASLAVQTRTGSTSTSVPVDGLNTVHNAYEAFVVQAAGSSFSGSASLSGSGTLSVVASVAVAATVALTGSGTLTASGTSPTPKPPYWRVTYGHSMPALTSGTPAAAVAREALFGPAPPSAPSGTAALSGSGTLTVTGTPGPVATAALSGSGTLTTTRTLTASGSASLTGTGALTATGSPTYTVTVPLSGSGTLAATGNPAASSTAALSGSGTLTAAGNPTASGAATLSGSGTLTAVSTGLSATATLTGSGTLTATTAPAVTATVALSGSGTLTGTGTPRPTATAALTGTGTLAATGHASTTAAVTLTGDGTLTADATASTTAAVALTGTGTLTATGVAVGPALEPGRILADRLTTPTVTATLTAATMTGTLHTPTVTGTLTAPTVTTGNLHPATLTGALT